MPTKCPIFANIFRVGHTIKRCKSAPATGADGGGYGGDAGGGFDNAGSVFDQPSHKAGGDGWGNGDAMPAAGGDSWAPAHAAITAGGGSGGGW